MEGSHCVREPLLRLHKFGGLVRGVLLSVSLLSSSSLYSYLASHSLLHGHLTPALYPVSLTLSFQAQQVQSSVIDLPNLWGPYMVPYNSCDQDQSLPISSSGQLGRRCPYCAHCR